MKLQNMSKEELISECAFLRRRLLNFQKSTGINYSAKVQYPHVEHLRIMLENSQEAIKVVQDETIKFASKNSSLIYGYSREEMIGKHMLEMIHPDDHSKVMNNHLERLDGKNIAPYSYRIIDKSGNVKWIEVSAIMSLWKGRSAIITFITDISRRIRAEEELQDSRRLLFDIVDFLPDATFAIDIQGRVIIWNKRMAEMVNIQPADMIGKGNYQYSITTVRLSIE